MQKYFQIQTLIKQLLTKYQIFTKLPQISHIHRNRNFFKYNWNFLDQLLLSYKFHDRDVWGIDFFIFASCEPLTARCITYLFRVAKSDKNTCLGYVF